MAPPTTRPEIGLGVCRRGVEAIGDRSESAIAAAVARCDYEAAAMTAIARARSEALPIEIAMTVLPGIELPQVVVALIACSSGDRTKLVDLLHHRRFPQTKENGELEAIVLYAAWLAGARPLAELRRLAARQMFADGYALLAAMAKQVDDANVALAVKAINTFDSEYAKEVAATTKSLAATVDATFASLPPEVVGPPARSGSRCARRRSRGATIRARAARGSSTRSAMPTSRSRPARRSPACRGKRS